MGHTIQFESHKVELAAIYQMEYDDNVLEYYDQPSHIKLNYNLKSGKNHSHLHAPDFFVIRTDNAGWEEWKSYEQLLKLVQSKP